MFVTRNPFVIALFFLLLFHEIICVQHFTLYRGIQYDRLNRALGTRKTSLTQALSIRTTLPAIASSGNATRKEQWGRSVLILSLDELLANEKNLAVLLDQLLMKSPNIAGLIVIVFDPTSHSNGRIFDKNNAFKKVEKYLLTRTIEKPIYFAYNNSEWNQLLNTVGDAGQVIDKTGSSSNISQLLTNLVGSDRYQITVADKEATEITGVKLVNIISKLTGKRHQTKTSIAIVANYDTVASVPEMTRGMASTASSSIGLIELSRIFKNLYSITATRGKYDIMFVLTSGGRLGYEGSRNWLKNMNPETRNSLQMVLCLENIAGQELSIHIPQKTNDEHIIRLFKAFTTNAKDADINMQFSQKAPVAGKEPSWEHEIFIQKKIYAATISSVLKPESQFLRTSALDISLNQTILERNIKLIAESLSSYIYDSPEVDEKQIRNKIKVNNYFVGMLVETLSQHSRYLPLTSSSSSAVDNLRNFLKQTAIGGQIQEDEFEMGSRVYKFYGSPIVTLDVYKVKPFAFDLLLAVLIALYLGALWVLLSGYRGKAIKKH